MYKETEDFNVRTSVCVETFDILIKSLINFKRSSRERTLLLRLSSKNKIVGPSSYNLIFCSITFEKLETNIRFPAVKTRSIAVLDFITESDRRIFLIVSIIFVLLTTKIGIISKLIVFKN